MGQLAQRGGMGKQHQSGGDAHQALPVHAGHSGAAAHAQLWRHSHNLLIPRYFK
jgi:hypothetical protein